MRERFKMKNEQVVLTGMVVGSEKGGECRTISKFPQWVTRRVALLINSL